VRAEERGMAGRASCEEEVVVVVEW